MALDASQMFLAACISRSVYTCTRNANDDYSSCVSSGGLSSYIMPAAAVGALGYCYMWWKVGSLAMKY